MANKDLNEKYNLSIINGINRLKNFLLKIESQTYPEVPTDYHSNLTKIVFDEFIKKYNPDKNSKILDVGCGQGPFLKYAKEKGFENIVGITLNDEDVKVCNELGFKVLKMDQSFLEFEDKTFDIIWARHVVEHSFMPLFTLHEYERILKPKGYLYMEVPGSETSCKHEVNPNHYSVLTKTMWLSLLDKSNFFVDDILDLNFDSQVGPDLYVGYFNYKKEVKEKTKNEKLYLALSAGENFGWGVCSKYLNKEVPKLKENTEIWNYAEKGNIETEVKGTVFHALAGLEFDTLSKIRGTKNIGYTFFENELTEESYKNSQKYELVLGGSTWCCDKMKEKGINNTDVLIQGIDPEVFYPTAEKKDEELFVIFSGGKFELRKGQDIVMKAVKIMQEKYNDIILINAWYNMWPKTMQLMQRSKHINYSYVGNGWKDIMNNLLIKNGIDVSKVLTYELINNKELRTFYEQTDVGLFPNRCEGGTNLVLMEYMACAKPVIASYNSGHKDVLNEENSYMIKEMGDGKIYSGTELWADWDEPSLDETVALLEHAYNNRDELRKKGKIAGEFMKDFTWKKSAESLVKIIEGI